MTTLELADLVLVASRTLGLPTDATLDLLDLKAAGIALTEAWAGGEPDDLPGRAAGLLHALVRHQPFQRGNDQIAVVATLQLISLNRGQVDLGQPEALRAVLAEVRAGTLGRPELTDWFAVRLHPHNHHAKEAPMRRRFPGGGRGPLFNRFTDRARRVTVLAQEEARSLRHNYTGTEHLLLGLVHETGGVAAKALQSLGISLEAVRAEVTEIIGRGESAPTGHIPFSPRSKKVLELALREALQLGHNYIGTEHVLLGLIREGKGVAAQVLVKLGADLPKVRLRVTQLLTGHTIEPAPIPRLLAEIDERIAEIRQEKDAAIDAEDFERAADLRRAERVMLEERAEREKAWHDGDPEKLAAETYRLGREVYRLRDLLRTHGIDPDNGAQRSA